MSNKNNLTSAKQLLDEVVDSKLYSQFLVQIQKDINRAGIDYRIKNIDPLKVFHEIRDLLNEKLQNTFNDYINLLYAVDVSEAKIKNTNLEDSNAIAEYATYLILEREWQKVCYRNML